MTVRREREMAERLHEAIADQKNAYYVHDLNRSVLAAAILANGGVFLPDAAELEQLRAALKRMVEAAEQQGWNASAIPRLTLAVRDARAALQPEGSAGTREMVSDADYDVFVPADTEPEGSAGT